MMPRPLDQSRDETPDKKRGPHPVDIHVGQRLREQRIFRHVSQQRLAQKLHLTFQQVQKYERGTNRISASKLYEAACFLGVPVSTFFEGLSDPVSGEAPQAAVNNMGLREQRAVGEMLRLKDSDVFDKVTALLKSINKDSIA